MGITSSLDPIFPLPAGTGIDRNLKPGEGKKILNNDKIVQGLGMTYRAFWHAWEQTELVGAKTYAAHVGGTHDNAAQAWLEAVLWFRRAAHPELDIDPISEKKAAKIRAREIEDAKPKKKDAPEAKKATTPKTPPKKKFDPDTSACPKCGEVGFFKKSKKGGFKCLECDHRFDPGAAERPQEAPEKAKAPKGPEKKDKATRKAKKKGKK